MFCIYVLLTLNHPTNQLSFHYMDILRSGALVSSATHTTERNAVKKFSFARSPPTQEKQVRPSPFTR